MGGLQRAIDQFLALHGADLALRRARRDVAALLGLFA